MKFGTLSVLIAVLFVATFGFFMMDHSVSMGGHMSVDCPIIPLFSSLPLAPVVTVLVLILLALVASSFFLSFLSIPVLAFSNYHQSPNIKLFSTKKRYRWLSLLENSPSL